MWPSAAATMSRTITTKLEQVSPQGRTASAGEGLQRAATQAGEQEGDGGGGDAVQGSAGPQFSLLSPIATAPLEASSAHTALRVRSRGAGWSTRAGASESLAHRCHPVPSLQLHLRGQNVRLQGSHLQHD